MREFAALGCAHAVQARVYVPVCAYGTVVAGITTGAEYDACAAHKGEALLAEGRTALNLTGFVVGAVSLAY